MIAVHVADSAKEPFNSYILKVIFSGDVFRSYDNVFSKLEHPSFEIYSHMTIRTLLNVYTLNCSVWKQIFVYVV